MSFTLFKIIRTRSKRTEELLKEIVTELRRLAAATEKLVPPAENVGELQVVEIAPVQEPVTEQERLDEEGIPKDSY